MKTAEILLVEDEAMVAEDLRVRLQQFGWRVVATCRTGEEALAFAGQRGVDLVLMDIGLPGDLDGIATAQQLRDRHQAPVVFLTAYSEDATLERAKLVEPLGYILKPYEDRELKSTIEIALHRHRAEVEIRRLNRLLDVLSQVNQLIVRAASRTELLPEICRLVVERGRLAGAWISWVEPGTDRMAIVARHGAPVGFLDTVDFHAGGPPETQGAPGRAVRTGRPVVCNDCGTLPCAFPPAQMPAAHGLKSCAAFPLRFQGQPCAALALCATEPDFFRARETDLFTEVAMDISFALDRFEEDRQRAAMAAALREQVALNGSIFETTPDFLVLKDRDSVYREVNGAFCRFLGRTRAEIVGRTDFDLFPPEEAAAYRAGDQKVMASRERESADWIVPGKAGRCWLHVIKTAVLDASGQCTGVLCSVSDVSTRKRAEMVQECRVRLLEFAADHTLDEFLVATLDEAEALTGSVVGFYHFLEADQQTLSLQAWSTRTGREMCQAEGNGRHYDVGQAGVWVDCIRERQPVVHNDYPSLPHRKGLPAGHATIIRELVVPVLRGDRIVAILGVGNKAEDYTQADVDQMSQLADVAWDIAGRKRAERALKDSEARYRRLVETSFDWVWESDADGRYTYASPRVREVLGYTPEEMLGRSPFEFMPAAEAQRVAVEFGRLAALRAPLVGFETLNLHKDGRSVSVETNGLPTFGPDGTWLGYHGMGRDITARKAMEAQLLQSQRIEAIGTLADGIAHDLNNILAPILLVAGMLRTKLTDEKDLESLEMLRRGAQRGGEIIKQLLTYSRGMEGKRKVIQPRYVLKEMLGIMRETFPREIDVFPSLAKDLWSVLADQTQLHQVVMNICVNARDAMPGGGTLILGASNVTLAAADPLLPRGSRPGPYVLIEVSDTGHGIPPEIKHRIFDPFFTTKPIGQGTGLGLSTVLGIVQKHEGFITVDSEPGRGTLFKVYLPAVSAKPAPAAAPSPARAVSGSGELILVVDDERDIRNSFRLVLEASGYRVQLASNGEEALTHLQRLRGQVRLVLTDLMMPTMNGLALIEALRREAPDLPIIAATGLEEIEKRATLKSRGVTEMLAKPCEEDQLLHAVRQALA